MKHYYLVFLICISACKQKNKSENITPAEKNISFTKDAPPLRNTVSKKPVASYLIPVGDIRLDRKFGVEIYETPHTFKYLLVMQYDGMIQNDTLKIPDFGIWPTVQVKPGKEKLSCIIGFLDKENTFREYKLLSAKDNNLTLTVLKSYGITAY
jgi:hypothetical protein